MNKQKIVKITLIILSIITVIMIVVSNDFLRNSLLNIGKIQITSFCGDLPQELYLEELKFSDKALAKIKKFPEETDEVYKVRKFRFSDKVKDNIEQYAKKNSMEYEYEEYGVSINGENTEDGDIEDLVLTKEEVANAKVTYKDEINEILKVFNLQKVYSVDDFEDSTNYFVTFVDKEGNERVNEALKVKLSIDLSLKGMLKDTKLKCDGSTPFLSISIDKKGNVVNILYENYNVKKVGKKYKLRTMKEIYSDIMRDKNVTVEGGIDAPLSATIDDVELVLYNDFDEKKNYMIPYFIMRGYNGTKDEKDDIYITMTAIQDRYLYFTE